MGTLINRSYVDELNCARIYCCLAADDAYILREVSSEIFECYDGDMLISFRDDVSEGNHGSGINFSEAQLMIVLVSNNFLNQSGQDGSMDEYLAAIKNNIPVLPIAIQSGIEEDFNEKCGKIELIFKYHENYQEILKENVCRLLTLMEIKNQVREHFYGNIFLSYRREDLKYAKKSMKEVHSFDICADVGIWYDGELVPGKDYEEEIFRNLKRCNFVLMMITPRLLEQKNFIMEAYPRVKALGIKILPYMVENIERETYKELCKNYDGLFDTYPGGIKSTEELRQAICAIYPEHHEVWDAEHYYCIGLAHFYGIDFERDVEKAIYYFKKAGEHGYINANKKLEEIYEHGIGTSIDVENAIEYQKNYIEGLKKEAELPCIEETILVKAMFKLGDLFKINKAFDDARNTYSKVFELFNLNPKFEQKSKYYLAIANVYEHIGILEKEMAIDADGYKEAYRNFLVAGKYIEDAERVADSANSRKQLALEYSRIAEHIAMILVEFEDETYINLADTYIQIAIRPYEEISFSDEIDNQGRKVLSRLYYENGLIEIKKFDHCCKNNTGDKKVLLEQISDINCILKNALEYCPETDYTESIRDIEAYRGLILVLEELKNIGYIKFRLDPSSRNLCIYEEYLRSILKILLGVNQDKIAKNALMNKVNECIRTAEFFAVKGYQKKAIDFYRLALTGLSRLGVSEYKKEIQTINNLIKQLS